MRRKEVAWKELEKSLIMDVIETRNLSLFSGKYLRKAEKLLESFYPGKSAILLNSGTAALHIALKAHGIGLGDEVIVPSITYPATALAVLHAGAKPVFAEVDSISYTLDIDSCDNLISQETKAVIFVHLFGVLGNIEAVADLCDSKGIILIEDCAQAFGSQLKKKQAGTFGQAGCFSFFESKTISAGEAGALILPNDCLLEMGRRYRHHGMDVINNDRTVKIEGFNYKPSEFQSALVVAQLTFHNEIIRERKVIVDLVNNFFCNNFKFQTVCADENAVLDKLCIIFKDIEERDIAEKHGQNLGFFQYLKNPLYREPVFSSCSPVQNFPISEFFCNHHLVFQISPYRSLKKIKSHLNDFITNYLGALNEKKFKKAQV